MILNNLQYIITHAPQAANWRLSPQGDDFWQDTWARLAIYAKPQKYWDLDYLHSAPPTATPAKELITVDLIIMSKDFISSIKNRSLFEVYAAYLTGTLSFAASIEFQDGRGPFWHYRYHFLHACAQGHTKFFHDHTLPKPDHSLIL